MLKNHALPPTIPLTSLSKSLNLKRVADYSSVQSLPEIFRATAIWSNRALKDPHAQPEVVLT